MSAVHPPRTPAAAGHAPGRASAVPAAGPVTGLSRADKLLPAWIGLAMAAGLILGRLVPALAGWLNAVKVGQTSLPIAVGLLAMMYPVLAKVRYDQVRKITAERRTMSVSLVMNWVIGPAVMFALAWLLLAAQPAYRTGVILVGLARCIAMVLIWTDLARGDREMAAVLVAINAVFQVLAYAALSWFYLQVLPGWLGSRGPAHLSPRPPAPRPGPTPSTSKPLMPRSRSRPGSAPPPGSSAARPASMTGPGRCSAEQAIEPRAR
jgi:hypothetical protein